jgi:ABC-type transport system involved in multi-copper enzyme maturation permease subunit
VLVLAPLAQLIPGTIGKHVHAYLPSEAGRLIIHAHQQAGQILTAWQGLAVFCSWTVLLLAGAVWLLNRRDA